MIRLICFYLFLALSLHAVHAQKISGIDFDLINSRVKDSASTFYYPKLIKRFKSLDTTLTDEEYKHIYYGNVDYEHYNPYGKSDGEEEFNSMYSAAKFMEAIPSGRNCLDQNPVNIRIIFRMAVCYIKTRQNDIAKLYIRQYHALLKVIYSSGNGNSIETAFVVIKVADEYDIISDMGFRSLGQSLIGYTDRLTVTPFEKEEEKTDSSGKKKKKKKKGKDAKLETAEIFFNVQKPFEYMSKMFKKNEDE